MALTGGRGEEAHGGTDQDNVGVCLSHFRSSSPLPLKVQTENTCSLHHQPKGAPGGQLR